MDLLGKRISASWTKHKKLSFYLRLSQLKNDLRKGVLKKGGLRKGGPGGMRGKRK